MTSGSGFSTTDEVVVVVPGGAEVQCSLVQRCGDGSEWTLELSGLSSGTLSAKGEGLWTAFTALRRQLDDRTYRICCAGARIDANMRSGRWDSGDVVDILSRRTLLGIRRTAPLLSYSPPSTIATVADQKARYERWLRTPWWRVLWPGDPTQ